MNPLAFVGVPDWRSALLAAALAAPWLILLAGRWLGRWQAWAVVIAGIVLFPLSIAWIQVPIQQSINALFPGILLPEAISRYMLLLGLPVIVVSGLVQETVKFGIAVGGLRLLGEKRPPNAGATMGADQGIAFGALSGAGYGAMEAFWVFNQIFAVGFTWATIQLGGIAALLGFIERFFVVMFHISVTSLSAYGYATRRPWRFLLLAIGLHSLVNYAALLLQAHVMSLAGVEIAVVLVAVSTLMVALRLHARASRPSPSEGADG